MIVSTNANNPNALKLVIAAKLGQHTLDIQIAASSDGVFGRLPNLILPDGVTLFSSSAAIQHLLPASADLEVLVNQWLEWDATQLQPALVAYGNSGSLDTSQKPRIWSLFNDLNKALEKKYLITTETTSADCSIWCSIWCTVAATPVSEEIATEFPLIERWLQGISKLPQVQESLKDFAVERGFKAIMSISTASWFPLNSYTGPRAGKEAQQSPSKDGQVSQAEIEAQKTNWSTPVPSVRPPIYPVLPQPGERNVLITSALPYVNNVPHLGNIIGCVLSADIFARYCRQRNFNTLFICGTDEYGTATEAKALEENMEPKQICDKYFSIHNDIYRWFGIGFDYFGRTTTPEQTEIVQDVFRRIYAEGYIITQTVEQFLCVNCQRFLADRFVEGTCPGCKYEDARGDQCDGCGHLINATELINPRCKVCSQTPVVTPSMQLFMDLPKIEPKLREWAASSESGWSTVARAVARPWLRDGLKPRCITRDLKWGIPVPLEGFNDKVFYVWFDAPLGYISITKRYSTEYERWWKPRDAQVSLYQFMAKDNVPFHAVMFPATLLAADEGHTLVRHIMATEYLNYEDTKFSKSRGIGLFGTDARETGIPADVWRFYLAYIRPETQDSNFNWVDLSTKVNSELLNNFGNFVNRALMFAEKNFEAAVPAIQLREEDLEVLALVQRELTQYNAAMEQAKLRDALRHMLMISKHGNQYVQSQQPWVMVKGSEEDKRNAATVVGVCCNLSCLLSALMAPFMPSVSRELRSQLGLDASEYGFIPETVSILLPAGHKIGKPSPLFAKIDDQLIESLKTKYGGMQSKGADAGKSTAKPAVPQGVDSIAALEEAIAKQGQRVRELKSKGDKSVWQPEVQILLNLKAQLAALATVKPATPEPVGGVAALEEAIAKQGQRVRELKSKEEKSVWQPEVKILLNLKAQLAAMTESSSKPVNSATIKAKKAGKASNVGVPNGEKSSR